MKPFVVACSALLLAACATQEHYSLEAPPALPKPAVAHVRSSPRHQEPRPAAAVSSAGPLRTAMVGPYMDAQEKDFRVRLRPTGALVARIGDDILVSWRNDALFSGSDLSGHGNSAVEQLSELLRHYDHSAVQVGGYTDTSGSADQNLALTQRRAKVIADTLVGDGVVPDRVSSQGYGAAHLKVATGPGRAEARNRRIEIRIIARPQA
jgi:outer membrane protein OmpA-like peptidoglycan-associated protein